MIKVILVIGDTVSKKEIIELPIPPFIGMQISMDIHDHRVEVQEVIVQRISHEIVVIAKPIL